MYRHFTGERNQLNWFTVITVLHFCPSGCEVPSASSYRAYYRGKLGAKHMNQYFAAFLYIDTVYDLICFFQSNKQRNVQNSKPRTKTWKSLGMMSNNVSRCSLCISYSFLFLHFFICFIYNENVYFPFYTVKKRKKIMTQ